MKLMPNIDQVTIPGLYQVLTVAVEAHPGEHGGMAALLRITIEQYHKLLNDPANKDKLGVPQYYTQSGETLYLWPKSDIERELEIQYHTHVMRV